MGINVKATERNVSFEKNKEKWAYVMMPETYSTLAASKVIDEASIRSGIPKGSLNASWAAIGDVVSAWTTEGHSVAIPGLGYIRFGIRSTSVPSVNEVSTKLISSRRVIFTPCSDIRKELASTPINITCYDRNGNIVKRVTSTDDSDIEDPEDDNPGGNGGSTSGGPTTRQYTLSVTSANTTQGTVTGGGTYSEGSRVNVTATPKSGYQFDKWSDGNTSASRTINVTQNLSLTAQFKAVISGGSNDDDDDPAFI